MRVKSAALFIVVGGVLLLFLFWQFAICAWVVRSDEFLVLRRKFGSAKPAGQILAQEGQRGVLEKTYGTGRHFINPIIYDVERQKATVIGPTQVGIVTSKAGPTPEDGNWLAERGQRGIWREVLGPGIYKMNPVAYKIEIVPMTRIPPGKIGVLINNLTSKVEERTLPPGLHKINTPRLYRVEIVDTGVKHLGLSKHGRDVITEQMLMEDELPAAILKSNRPTGGSLGFPSKDGFNVGLDASIVYEIEPRHAVSLISKFGRTEALTTRIIEPALNSITRNVGSSVTAKEMIQGETRIEFQQKFTETFFEELDGEPVKAIDALPRGLYVPPKIQLPIMQATIKQELKLTNKEIELTTERQNEEQQERTKIDFEIQKVKSETSYEVANISSENRKVIQKYQAETNQMVAEIALKIARINAEIREIKSQGEAEVVTYAGNKKAELIQLKAGALGSKDALVQLHFVDALPEQIPFRIIHAGEGTLWTDLKALSGEQKAVLGQLKRSR